MPWIVEAKDPLIFGDGRIVGDVGGNASMNLPWPSTIAGMVRTLAGSDSQGHFDISKETIERVKKISIKGPWITSLQSNSNYFVAPKDAVWNKLDNQIPSATPKYRRTQLVPKKIDQNHLFDQSFPYQCMVSAIEDLPDGKTTSGPMFWSQQELSTWLTAPSPKQDLDNSFGIQLLHHDQRIHVAIDASSKTAKDGQLFSSDSVIFYDVQRKEELAICLDCEDETFAKWNNKPCFLGGERRIAHLRRQANTFEIPQSLSEKLKDQDTIRVVLLTPAIFDEGSTPKAIFGCTVIASIVGRPEVISGWDYEKRCPKPSRRLVPAGSIFWIDVSKLTDKSAWISQNWFTSCSSAEQDQCDGFGICVMGVTS